MKNNKPHANSLWIGIAPAVLALAVSGGALAQTLPQPSFEKTFAPATIGPGSTATLSFTVDNTANTAGVDQLAFTDTLPAGVTIAAPANALSTCGGTLDAPEGGGTITFSDGGVGALSACSISVDVTSSTPGTHMNVSGALTSSAGTSGTATDDLIVATTLPGFTKSFAPDPVPLGGRSTLTFTIDNSLNGSGVENLDFTDNLPVGMVIADPANTATDCRSPSPLFATTLSAIPGTSVISLDANGFSGAAFEVLPAGATCTVTVDVTATSAGLLGNVSEDLLADFVFSGKASATLEVTVTPIALIKSFTDDPVPQGGTVDLEFTILNLSRVDAATVLSFDDNLDATLTGLAAVGPPTPNPPCGAGSTLTGAGLISLSGGNLPPEGSCTFSVPVQVPLSAATGAYPNTTTALTGDVGGLPVTANQASDVLFVSPAPVLAKNFLVDPVAAGGTTTLEFTITNTSPTSAATDIAFIDELTTFLPFPVSVTLPAVGFCGPGATIALIFLDTERQGLSMTGGSLAPAGMAGDSCTFTVDIDIPATMPGNVYVNTTQAITATVDDATVTGNHATDTLTIVAAPSLTKEFTDDPVPPGGTVTLQFTLTHDALAPADATGVTFTDDLAATLTGLTGTGLPLTDLCGPGNGTLTGSAGDTLLTFSGATLTPGQVCTFPVTLQVAAGSTSGIYTNTTSDVTATVAGLAASGNPGQDDLVVTGFVVTKEFLDDPAIPGGTVTLRFTLDNANGAVDATNIFFFDNLSANLSGLAAVGLPAPFCGGTLSGTSLLIFTGGTVTAGSSCSFSVTLQIPSAAADGTYSNTTSNVTVDLPTPTVLPPATDALTVVSDPLSFNKSFTDDPVAPAGAVTLEFTLTNLAAQAASAIGFTDDLDATLTGLVATGLPAPACGGTLTGTSTITLSGASLGAGASCTFSATLSVPPAASAGTYANTTSQVTGLIGGLPVTGDPASDDLLVQAMTFTKTFDGPTVAGGSPVLSFTIENQDAATGVANISFTDDLDAVVAGLVATGLPASDVCGPGSQLSGTLFLTLTGGNLGPSGTCVIPVTLQVPAAVPGTYPNTTSDLFLAGLPVAAAASADLTVEPPPLFSKSFAPALIVTGGTSTLTFTVDNSASALAASGLDFTDNVPAGVTVANPPNASTTCTGGTLTATAGTGVIAYTGGSVPAASVCTIGADVTSATAGAFVNTSGDLTSSSGNSGPASDTLTVDPAPVTSFTGPTATGTGQATATISGGGPTCQFTSAAFVALSSVAVPPPDGLSFPQGLFTYVLENCTPGATVAFTIAYPPPLPPDTELWKFGPTLADPNPHWYTLPSTVAADVLSFSVTDGGLGDNDLTADGTIVDPLGPASRALASATGIPLIGPWGLALLILALGLLAGVRSRGAYASRRA